jgi:hypothetical protein
MEARVIYCSKLLKAQRDAANGTNNAAANGKKARKPRYKFDPEWVEAVRHNYDRDLDNDEAVLRHIRLYIEGEYDGSDFRGTYFECAWILIKAEIDRRKARNARARERRQQRRAEKLAAIEAAKAAEQAAAEAARIEAEAKAQAEAEAREEAEAAARAEAERLAAEQAAEAKAREEAEVAARAEAERLAAEKAVAEAKAREEAEAKAKVEAKASEGVETVDTTASSAALSSGSPRLPQQSGKRHKSSPSRSKRTCAKSGKVRFADRFRGPCVNLDNLPL